MKRRTIMNRENLFRCVREFSRSAHAEKFVVAAAKAHPSDLAEALELLEPEKTLALLSTLDARVAAGLFAYFSRERRKELLTALSGEKLAELFEHMASDDRVDIFVKMDGEAKRRLLSCLTGEARENLLRLSAFPEGTAGAAATSEFVALRQEMDVAEALACVRSEASDRETIYTLYVVDQRGRLCGTVSLRDLLMAGDGASVDSIMCRNPVSAGADWPGIRAVELIRRYDLLALPVLDEEDRLIGIITVDDAMDIEKEQDATRIVRFGGTAAEEGTELDILVSPLGKMFGVRVFWLALLTLFGVVTSTFVAAQEEMLSHVIVLAAFIAPIVDMGGNTGSQSATLVIRAMALGDVNFGLRDIWLVLRREVPVAAALGLCIALLEAVLAFFSKHIGMDVLLVVGLSMLVCTVLGGIIGVLLPFLARRVGTDPATLSSPLITSIMDLIGVFVYFSFAYALLGSSLLQAG